MRARVCAVTAHLYALNFKQNQGAFDLKQPAIFQRLCSVLQSVSSSY